MNEEILFSDVQPRFILALVIGVVVMIFLLIFEHLYKKKHPEAFVENPNKEDIKQYYSHISNMFIIIFVYILSLLAFITTFSYCWSWWSLLCFLLLAIIMIWHAYNIRK